MSCLQIGHPPCVFRLQFFVWVTTLFIFWHEGRRQFASRHWHAWTSDWMHLWMDCFLASCGLDWGRPSVGEDPSSRSNPRRSILCGWPIFSLHGRHKSKSWIIKIHIKNFPLQNYSKILTSQIVQWYLVSTWFLQWLQVYTNLSCPWLCSSYNMHMVENWARLRDENS